ncbi:MAG: DUF2726 domain-containing protein [Candidatus Moranbacteria bacterium]|nr:DUF2726 domain-containing protein [Candidatus Moranbacteria bacterium]
MKKKQIDKVLYLKNDSLLTQSEQKFYFILAEILQDRYLIFSKVRIPDIVHIPEWYKPYYWAIYWWDRIKSKHVDFLVCDRNSFEPLLVIEVDDPLHLLPKGKKRDVLVNFVFRKARLPILRLTDKSLENKKALEESIESSLKS